VDALPTRDNPKVDLGVEIRGALIPADRALSGPKRARLHAVDPEAEPSLEGAERLERFAEGLRLPQTGIGSMILASRGPFLPTTGPGGFSPRSLSVFVQA
jgi:hypothetical protein